MPELRAMLAGVIMWTIATLIVRWKTGEATIGTWVVNRMRRKR